MGKFTNGLIAGGLIGSVGLTYFLSDKRNRNRMLKDGRKLVKKSKKVMDDLSDYM